MALEIRQSLKLSQQLVMTPQLQQAIKLLQLNRLELLDTIQQEMVENPTLEEGPEQDEAPTPEEIDQKRQEDAATTASQSEGDKIVSGKEEFDWEQYVEESANLAPVATPTKNLSPDELPNYENMLTKSTSLEEHLRWQVGFSNMTDEERVIAEEIIGNLNEDGYFTASLEEIAKNHDFNLEDAEEILKMIQEMDPIGVCSRNIQECLLRQLTVLGKGGVTERRLVEEFLPELERKNYQIIVKAMGISLDQVIESTKLIMELEPKPGRSFQNTDTHYVTPDIYVYKVGDEYVIVLNEDGMPKLRISSYYRSVLQRGEENATSKEYIQEKVRSAMWLIKSIHNRQKTIFKVMESIVKHQRDFFEKGVSQLRPMVLRDVANDIGMHESTISRVTTNKYVHTPVGLFELKYFFNTGISSSGGGDDVASESVKDKIRQLVGKEDPKRPLSDQKLVELLGREGIDIARRTVAKYREMLGILSSSKRKRLF